jgi:hypothetical protein
MQSVIMFAEDVLRIPVSEGHYDDGVALYRSLTQESRLYLISGLFTEANMDRWLFQRGLRGHIGYEYVRGTEFIDYLGGVKRFRGSSTPAFIVDANLSRAARFLRFGYPMLCLARPHYTDPRWRPDHTPNPQPWDELREELERQEELRYTDERLREI